MVPPQWRVKAHSERGKRFEAAALCLESVGKNEPSLIKGLDSSALVLAGDHFGGLHMVQNKW